MWYNLSDMITKKGLIIFIFLFALCGCAIVRDFEGIMTLKRYGDSQAEMQKYVERQTRLFNKLVEDVKDDKLEKGMAQRTIVRMYGDPVLTKEIKGDPPVKEKLLYRHPLHYFTSDKVYMYFSDDNKLLYWKYVPYVEKKY